MSRFKVTRIGFAVLAAGMMLGGCRGGGSSGGKGAAPPCQPALTDLAPSSGDVAGDSNVTIFTACFQDDFTVDPPVVFFGVDAALGVTPINSTTVVARTPPHAVAETVDVTVESTNVTETATMTGGFTFTGGGPGSCTVTAVTPAQGPESGGGTVLVDGSNFDLSPPPLVEFGTGNPSPMVVPINPDQISVTVPPGPPGFVDIIVTNQASTCMLGNGYEYEMANACSVTAATPNNGDIAGGDTIVIDGSGFAPASPVPTVQFGAGNFSPTVTVIDSTQIEAVTPAVGSAGFVDVIVTPSGVPSCTLASGFEYTFTPPPSCSVTGISTSTGPENGGNQVTLTGSGFVAGTLVDFGLNPSPDVVVVSGTQMDVIVPPGSGTVDVFVDTGAATCSLLAAYTYFPCTGCGGGVKVQSTSPNTGTVGDIITVNGNKLEAGAYVYVGGGLATVTDGYASVPGSIQVEVPVPKAPWGQVDVEVVNPSGVCCTGTGIFTYTGCYVGSVTPATGAAAGGETITIDGAGFDTSPAPQVWFGTEQSPNVTPFSSTQLQVETPPANGQTVVDVMVVNQSSQCTLTGGFQFQ